MSNLPKKLSVTSTKAKAGQILLGYANEADIRALFELAGMVAKADGEVSKQEIAELENFIRCQLLSSQRDLAIEAFRKGKEVHFVKSAITARAFQLYGLNSDRWLEPVQVLDILLRLSLVDGEFSAKEEFVVDSVRGTLGVHKRSYWTLRDTLAERWGITIRREGASFAKKQLSTDDEPKVSQKPIRKGKAMSRAEALLILELNEDSTGEQIKIAHRTLVKRYHPDLMESKQVSEEKIKEAVRRFCEIQEAYEALLGAP